MEAQNCNLVVVVVGYRGFVEFQGTSKQMLLLLLRRRPLQTSKSPNWFAIFEDIRVYNRFEVYK